MMGERMENARFQARELRAMGYDAEAVADGGVRVVTRLTVAQAIFLQGCHATANTREARKAARKAGEHKDVTVPDAGVGKTVKFTSKCSCGDTFYGEDQDDADFMLQNHHIAMEECTHSDGAEFRDDLPGTFCNRCGVKVTWMGPGHNDYAPVS